MYFVYYVHNFFAWQQHTPNVQHIKYDKLKHKRAMFSCVMQACLSFRKNQWGA